MGIETRIACLIIGLNIGVFATKLLLIDHKRKVDIFSFCLSVIAATILIMG